MAVIPPSHRPNGRAARVAAGRTLTIAAPAIGEYPQTVITSRTERKSTPTSAPKSSPRQAFAGHVRVREERQPSSSAAPRPEDPFGGDATDERNQPERRHGHGSVVRGHHPGDALDRGVEVTVKLWQR